jgi:serine/threonine-protein kinase RsbW
VLATVEDQGPGFDLKAVTDPLHPDNLERPTGRGLLLIRALMTAVAYSRLHRRLVLWKRRSASS